MINERLSALKLEPFRFERISLQQGSATGLKPVIQGWKPQPQGHFSLVNETSFRQRIFAYPTRFSAIFTSSGYFRLT